MRSNIEVIHTNMHLTKSPRFKGSASQPSSDEMCHVSAVLETWAPSWFGWSAKFGWSGNAVFVSWKQACHSWSPTKIAESSPSCPSREPLPAVCKATPDAEFGFLSKDIDDLKGSRGNCARSRASSRPACGKRGGQRSQRRKRATPFAHFSAAGRLTTTSSVVHVGGPQDVSRREVRRVAPGTKSCENSRSALKTTR